MKNDSIDPRRTERIQGMLLYAKGFFDLSRCVGLNVEPVGHAARQIVEGLPLPGADLDAVRPRAVAGADAPAGLRGRRRTPPDRAKAADRKEGAGWFPGPEGSGI